jgi:hypothetical protein
MNFEATNPMAAHDKNLHAFGRAALLRRPRVQGRAAALPYQEGGDLCPAPQPMAANILQLQRV